MESILTSIKKMLGIEAEYTHFDPDIIFAINSALMVLNQIGLGPTTGFVITGPTEIWKDFIGDRKDVESLKTYVYAKTKLLFDPPANSFLVEAMERQIKEFEWRLNLQAEATITTTTEEGGTISE